MSEEVDKYALFNRIYTDDFQDHMYKMIYSHRINDETAKDIFQLATLGFWKTNFCNKSYDDLVASADKYQTSFEQNLKNIIRGTIRNKVTGYKRAQYRSKEILNCDLPKGIDIDNYRLTEYSPAIVYRGFCYDDLDLGILSRDEVDLLYHRFWKGLSTPKISKILGTTPQTVQRRLKMILKKLKKQIPITH